MGPSVAIHLRDETLQAIQDDASGKEDLFIEDLMKSTDQIISLIRNYEREREHKGRIHRFHPINTITLDRTGDGSFTLFFPVNIFNGCKGIDADFDDKVHITIEVDVINKIALLIGEEKMPEREPDDC